MPFTRSAIVRAIRTAAQTAIGAIGAATLVAQVDWPLVASTAAAAVLVAAAQAGAAATQPTEGDTPT